MNYELAKKLKYNGFPQGNERFINKIGDIFTIDEWGDNMIFFPTLSELIEVCGKRFWTLTKELDTKGNNFIASGWKDTIDDYITTSMIECKTPEEAVANLWLKLNKK